MAEVTTLCVALEFLCLCWRQNDRLTISTLIAPDAVPAKKKRRFGYVWHSVEQKKRWPIGKCLTSGTGQREVGLIPEAHRDRTAGPDEPVVAPVVIGLVAGVPGLAGNRVQLARRGGVLSKTFVPLVSRLKFLKAPRCRVSPSTPARPGIWYGTIPSRLSKEWFSMISTTMCLISGMLAVPAGRWGKGRLPGWRRCVARTIGRAQAGRPFAASAAAPPAAAVCIRVRRVTVGSCDTRSPRRWPCGR